MFQLRFQSIGALVPVGWLGGNKVGFFVCLFVLTYEYLIQSFFIMIVHIQHFFFRFPFSGAGEKRKIQQAPPPDMNSCQMQVP